MRRLPPQRTRAKPRDLLLLIYVDATGVIQVDQAPAMAQAAQPQVMALMSTFTEHWAEQLAQGGIMAAIAEAQRRHRPTPSRPRTAAAPRLPRTH